MAYSGWPLSILPYLEQQAVYNESLAAFKTSPSAFNAPPHVHIRTVINTFVCPSDTRAATQQTAQLSGRHVAFTCYLGVSGRDYSTKDGVLLQDTRIAFASVTDGLSNTLLLGERPPSNDFQLGWWYAGTGQRGTGSADMIMGVEEVNLFPTSALPGYCGPGSQRFEPAKEPSLPLIKEAREQNQCGLRFIRFGHRLHPSGKGTPVMSTRVPSASFNSAE